MARAGRKRSFGERYANDGKLKKPTMQALNEMNAEKTADIIRVASQQPHRIVGKDLKGRPVYSTHAWRASALGRFCDEMGCRRELHDGVEAYVKTHQRWLRSLQPPRGCDNITILGSGEGPTAEQVRNWKTRIDAIDGMLIRSFPGPVVKAALRIAIEDQDITTTQKECYSLGIRAAFGEIAIMTGFLESNPHPFK